MESLEQARVSRGLTVFDVAQRAAISPSNLRRYERGVRNLPVQVAQALGLVYGIDWWLLYPNYYPNGLS